MVKESTTTVTTGGGGKFGPNDRVLCYHGQIMYDAKVLDVVVEEEGRAKYFLHYQGWNNRWDEWVDQQRVVQYNEENVKKQEELAVKHGQPLTTGGGGPRGRPPGDGGSSSASRSSAKAHQATGGKSKSSAGSSGPSTPFDASSTPTTGKSGIVGGTWSEQGLELESRASTPSVDGGASVASSNTTTGGSGLKRKAAATGRGQRKSAKQQLEDPVVVVDTPATGSSGEPKRKRARPGAGSAATTTATSAPSQATTPQAGSTTAGLAAPDLRVESLDEFRGRNEVAVKIPDELKDAIVDDWDMVSRQNKLYKLPATKTIDHILREFVKDKKQQKGLSGLKLSQAEETANGLRAYFNNLCGAQLLYRFERAQYQDVLSGLPKGQSLSGLYGLPHLLRLFTRIGHMLAYTKLEAKSIELIQTWFADMLRFLARNKHAFFIIDDYQTASPAYVRQAYAAN